MAVMDYSQQQRVVIDGTGRILDTTMSNPNVGSWVSEAQLKTWINTGMATDADLAAEESAREAEDTNLKNALDSTNARVENLEQEHGSYNEVTAKSPYTIPSGKAKNWSVNVLRGVTRASNQLATRTLSELKYYNGSGTWNDNVYTLNGLSFTVNGDGSITVTGTASETTAFWVTNNIQGGTSHSYFIAGCPSGGSTTSYMLGSNVMGKYDVGSGVIFTIGGTTHPFIIRIYGGYAISGSVTFMPVVRDLTLYFGGSIPSDADTIAKIQTNYPELLIPSAYGSSLVSTRYEGVKTKGSNRMSLNGLEAFTASNVTFTPTFNSDGELEYLTATGTSNASGNLDLLRYDNFKLPYGTYFLGFGANNLLSDILVNVNGTWVTLNKNGGTITVTDPSQAIWVRGRFASGVAFGGAKLYPKVNIGSTELPFSPYMTDTLSLPTPITLRSAGTVAEEYDLESGEKSNPLGSYTFTGNESWTSYNSVSKRTDIANLGAKNVGASVVPNLINDMGLVPTSRNAITSSGGITVSVTTIIISNDSVALATAGKKIYFELETPDAPTQLDPIQNPYLATESGGTISSILTDAVDDSMTLGYINL